MKAMLRKMPKETGERIRAMVAGRGGRYAKQFDEAPDKNDHDEEPT
jgi:hypothetical protein